VRVCVVEERARAFEREAQHESRRARGDGQLCLPVVELERAVAVGDAHLFAFQHTPELVAENGKQHAILQARVRRVPVNVEVAREL
jgi:hypothetical protein